MGTVRRLTARVEGRVQGVGFRAFVVREARRLGVKGSVRNCPDGAVETVAEGPEEKLRALESTLRRGPSASRVEHVDTEWSDATGEFSGFNIGY
jgi:acylphosphatase